MYLAVVTTERGKLYFVSEGVYFGEDTKFALLPYGITEENCVIDFYDLGGSFVSVGDILGAATVRGFDARPSL